ncbi:putative N-acetylglucosamine-1-phosphotransferase subunits alpha/beta-like [Apostichopus japonicus]|uniref:Putative N-acetylglucosamine-1-phosphotransferase subunits alpha/beta-like n=1 Tax=Stichopus japonicus TaxID=307972 RepID=A0A2G8JTX1_STIJA|nr:putative N-acetylglucosamine-1-phosphotransferase subunits alpha/beta-like [Apostichopus japonicus]
MNNIVMAIGLEKDSTEENVKSKVPEAQREFVSKVDLRIPSSAAILTISKDGDMNTIITEAEKSTVESEIKLVSAFLVWNLEMEFDGDMSPNRFEDNEALRYSLRSLEKHAPWIRNVYIVTNGQIPAWINLDNSRLTLVSHSEIFVNQSHLPSFSSPAIESHLHRIPGLSEKFIYLNDDTMFGKDVWPDDFYTHAGGQKVYLTWPVPNCAEGCPSSWIKDNYCDKACNTSECDWDGGDCTGVDAPGPVGGAAVGGGGDSNLESLYCSNGCANSWVADKYCDTSCNNVDCGYDAGDCGTTNLGKLYSEKITGPVNITLPKGLQVAFFNVTPIFGKAGSIAEGHYQAGGIVRTATIAQLFKTVHLLLYKNFTETEIVIRVNGKDADGEPAEVYHAYEGLSGLAILLIRLLDLQDQGLCNGFDSRYSHLNDSINRKPQIDKEGEAEIKGQIPEVAEELLNDDVKGKLAELDKLLQEGDLTEKGYNQEKTLLLTEYIQSVDFDEQRRLVAERGEGGKEEGDELLEEKEQKELTNEQKELLVQRRAEKHEQLEAQIQEEKNKLQFVPGDGQVGIAGQVDEELKQLLPNGAAEPDIEQKRSLQDDTRQQSLLQQSLQQLQSQGLKAVDQQNVLQRVEQQQQGIPLHGGQGQIVGQEAGQQQMFGQQIPGQQQMVGQQLAGQQIAGQQQMVGQQQMAGQQIPEQQIAGQQQMVGQQIAGQQQMVGQQIPGQQIAGQQQMVGQQIAGQQQMVGQQIPGQQIAGQQQMVGQQIPEQQQMVGQQIAGQQQMVGQQIPDSKYARQQQIVGQQQPGLPLNENPQRGNVQFQQPMQKPYIPDFNFQKLHQDIQEKLEHKILEERKPEGDSQNKIVVNGEEGEDEAERVAEEKEEGAGIEISPNKNDDNQGIMKDTIKRRRLLSVEYGQRQTLLEKSKSNAKRSAAIFENEVRNSKDIPIGKWRIPNLGQDLLLRMKISDGKGITKEEKLAIIRGREDYEKGASKTMDRLEPLNQEMVNINEKYSKENSFLPWERSNLFANKSDHSEENRLDDYQHLRHRSRKLLDTYGNSLRYVNKLYNKKFGFVARKVPAHMVHMVDVNVMNELQNEFSEEFDLTSSHRIRHSQDMQFSFAYMYYMMSTPKEVNASEVFDEFDTDGSGILSDREIRTLATRLYELPLDLQTLSGLEKTIINCSKFFKEEIVVADPEKLEEYYVKEMPQVSKALMLNCGPVIKKMEASVEGQTKYKYEIMGEEEIAFKMIRTNVSHVIGQLDDVRKNPKKFVCLNDNINHNAEGAKMVKAVLQDYYEAMFPIPSQFELPREYRNRFLHIDELSECWSVARGDAAVGGEGEFAEIYRSGSSMYDGDGNHNGIVLILLEEEFCTYFQCADFAQWLSFVCVQGCVVKKMSVWSKALKEARRSRKMPG